MLHKFASIWLEIQPTNSLRAVAERMLGVHALRAADAFQLAAALQWCRGETSGMSLVCFDSRLRSAAHREGFTVLPANKIPSAQESLHRDEKGIGLFFSSCVTRSKISPIGLIPVFPLFI